jgi:hypothetical protein
MEIPKECKKSHLLAIGLILLALLVLWIVREPALNFLQNDIYRETIYYRDSHPCASSQECTRGYYVSTHSSIRGDLIYNSKILLAQAISLTLPRFVEDRAPYIYHAVCYNNKCQDCAVRIRGGATNATSCEIFAPHYKPIANCSLSPSYSCHGPDAESANTSCNKAANCCEKDADCKYIWYTGSCNTPEYVEAQNNETLGGGPHPSEAPKRENVTCTCEKRENVQGKCITHG